MNDGFAFDVGHEVVCWDDIAQAPTYGVIVAIDFPYELCVVRISTDNGISIVQPTTFSLIEELNQ